MRQEVAEELVASWHRNGDVLHAVAIGILCSGEIPDRTFNEAKKELGVASLMLSRSRKGKRYVCTRKTLGALWSLVNDALWSGVPDQVCVNMLMTIRPDVHSRAMFCDGGARRGTRDLKCTRAIRARELDKRHDWKTVK